MDQNQFAHQLGTVFARRERQSGSVVFGVENQGQRWFLKTAGAGDSAGFDDRLQGLKTAATIGQSIAHVALVPLVDVQPLDKGVVLVFDWVQGDNLYADADQRRLPTSAHWRFLQLPVDEVVVALGAVMSLHDKLARLGWVAGDFYDGSLMYDFRAKKMWVIDMDLYRQGPFTNLVGRLFGSSRFLAPEQWSMGAWIDHRTTVFNLGRMMSVFLGDTTLKRSQFRASDALFDVMNRACASDPKQRFTSPCEMYTAYSSSRFS